ncbi:MAG TPA: HD domain-containing phosphohydrolase [Gemmatimonadales bacterium]|nr:HD domain-containing phosphohydrolase [Gemmatimonadales bacterium]
MSDPSRFLTSLAQALSTMSLYPEGHPAREGIVDVAYANLQVLQKADRRVSFSFLGDDVVFGDRPLRELRGWDWSNRLAGAGVQRVEFETEVTREEFESFLTQLMAKLTLFAVQQAGAAPRGGGPIKFGAVGIKELESAPELQTATIALSLHEEAETIQWLHEETQGGSGLPLAEAEAVVRSLAAAMHGDQAVVLPLLELRRYDEYTTTHSLNVCVLAMGLAEWVGLGARDVRAFGVAGLLHDIGKVKIPGEILNKAGRLTPEEREVMNRHPVEGARIIMESQENLDLAAVVAYEHHIMQNGGGYPRLDYPRECHQASKLVHVCDVYDALRTNRPYRAAWPAGKVLDYVEERAGTEFEPDIARRFVKMMSEWEPRQAALDAEPVVDMHALPLAPSTPAAAGPGSAPAAQG